MANAKYLPDSCYPKSSYRSVKKCKGSKRSPKGDKHNVPENFLHEKWEQDAQQLHEDKWRIYEVYFMFKEYQVIYVDHCIGHSNIL